MPPFQIEILLLNSNIPNGDKAPEIFPHIRMFPNSLYVAQFFFSQNPNYLPLTTTASGPHIPQCFLACCSIWKFCSAVHLLIRLSFLDICLCQFQHHQHRCCNYFQQCGSFFRKFKNMTLNGIIISKLSKCKVRPHKIDICTPRKVYWPVAVDRGWGEMGNIGFPKKNSSVSASHLSSHTQKPSHYFDWDKLCQVLATVESSQRVCSRSLSRENSQLPNSGPLSLLVKVKGSKTFARWWPTSSCPTRLGASDQQVAASPPVQLDLHQLAPLLLLLLGVLLLALLLLLVEVAAPLAKQGKISSEFFLQICFFICRLDNLNS